MNSIEIKNLNKSYGEFSLKDINLEIPKGYIVGLIGKNGSGKTTLIKTILNITTKDSGSVKINGVENTSDQFTIEKENIGVVLDELGIYDGFDVRDVDNNMKKFYKNWNSKKFEELLIYMDIYSNKIIRQFSTGMKKKLNVAISLGYSPDLLILDEPTANLDPFVREELLDLLYEYTRDEEKTILISSHILSDLEKICDYIVYMEDGEVVLFESKDNIVNNYSIVKVNSEDYITIPKNIILHEENYKYGRELLVNRKNLPESIVTERATLDDILIKLVKSNSFRKEN